MMYLCILFVPPLYFMVRGKWGGFFLNSFLYGLALLCVLSIIGIMIAPVFWLLAVGHASFAYRKEATMQHAELIATKMADKMRENQTTAKQP